MTSSHKISFSIIDILDPNKFNSKRVNELSTVKEKFPVPNAERTSLEPDSPAGEDLRDDRTEAGRKPHIMLLFYHLDYRQNVKRGNVSHFCCYRCKLYRYVAL